ncbi:predicted protein [Paecilomyces variotii No. 5]|uniref:Fungal-type protein kinase domain-containing protein n=1 Tax=Byssochlamys spectabilis (strain No. 5 / NBRC 109023) TaxID=1356009 RepID=V5F9Q8_BYSSN|nr:predicted protein [Paecilomyces variotii No. 5]
MDNLSSLLEYLEQAPSPIPVATLQGLSDHKMNDANGDSNIRSISLWIEFTLDRILQSHECFLTHTFLASNPFPTSPPPIMSAKTQLMFRISEYLAPRLRRALRTTFNRLESTHLLSARTPISFDMGGSAKSGIDFAYYEVKKSTASHGERLPGIVKPSWEWNSGSKTGSTDDKYKYYQCLDQLNWSMKQLHARYGIILTNEELVAVQRLDNDGNLQVSSSIAWETKGTAAHPRLTVLLALWYLGMLASENQEPNKWEI